MFLTHNADMHVKATITALVAVASAASATHTTKASTQILVRSETGEEPKAIPDPLAYCLGAGSAQRSSSGEEATSALEQYHLTPRTLVGSKTAVPEMPKVTGPPVIIKTAVPEMPNVTGPPVIITTAVPEMPKVTGPPVITTGASELGRSPSTFKTDVLEPRVTRPLVAKGEAVKTRSGKELKLEAAHIPTTFKTEVLEPKVTRPLVTKAEAIPSSTSEELKMGQHWPKSQSPHYVCW